MSQHSIQEHYYSGQGIVLLGLRGADGKPKGLRPVGNCPDLKITIAPTLLEHKESTTGQRATDLRLTTELKCSISMTLENFKSANLADALRGVYAKMAGATVTGGSYNGYIGKVTALGHLQVSSVVVKTFAVTLTPYTNDTTPYDYILNAEAGSIMFNDGSILAQDKFGETITGVTVGATTSLAIVSSGAVVGSKVIPRGLTGADAADLNGKEFTVVSNSGTAVVISAVTTGKTITSAAGSKLGYDGIAVSVDYTYVDQYKVDALTEGATEYYLRFEGLNTAKSNSPVVVEIFRILADPLKELSLISDAVQQFVLEGSALADTTRVTGSKFFSAQQLI